MLGIRADQKSISRKVQMAKDILEEDAKEKLTQVARTLSVRIPVQTGAYARSFSVVPSSSGGGRMVTSDNKPWGQDVDTYQRIALSNMTADIAGLQLSKIKGVSFRNRAPHSGWVEDNYQVFGAAKDIFR